MANENKGITLAQIRSGAKEFVLDNSTVSDDIRAVQVALRVLGYWGSPNNPDGSFGSYSVAATRGYQKENVRTLICGGFESFKTAPWRDIDWQRDDIPLLSQ